MRDVLAVEELLRQMREEIEVHEIKLRELKTNVALSTITLTFYEVGEAIPPRRAILRENRPQHPRRLRDGGRFGYRDFLSAAGDGSGRRTSLATDSVVSYPRPAQNKPGEKPVITASLRAAFAESVRRLAPPPDTRPVRSRPDSGGLRAARFARRVVG